MLAWQELIVRVTWVVDRQLRALEDENARLKRVVADLSLDKHILTEALRKKF